MYVDAVIARVADILGTRPEHADTCRDELRALAFGWLARPAELLALLLEHTESDEPDEPDGPEPARALAFPADLLDALRSVDPDLLRPTTVLYLHLHEAALTGTPGVARVEGIGAHALSQLAELLAGTEITVKPVIDLRDRVSVNAYEHPTRIAERIHLEQPGDAFPHATAISRSLDLDHASPTAPKDHPVRPASTTPNHSAALGTAPRPTSATGPHRSRPGRPCGAPRTDSTELSTTPAPTTSPPPTRPPSPVVTRSSAPSSASR